MCHLPGSINQRRRDTVIVGHTSTERTFPLVAVRPRAGAEAIVLNVCLWHEADLNHEAAHVWLRVQTGPGLATLRRPLMTLSRHRVVGWPTGYRIKGRRPAMAVIEPVRTHPASRSCRTSSSRAHTGAAARSSPCRERSGPNCFHAPLGPSGRTRHPPNHRY